MSTRKDPDGLKVLVIGIDGATFDLIKPWIEKGKLPTIRKLMEEGSYGNLKSTIPPLTSPAWTSFYTGKNPGKHGLFDFWKRDRDRFWRLVTSKDRKAKPIWTILNENGIKVGVFYFPITYPADKVNGFMVTGLGTPHSRGMTYPKSLRDELSENIEDYEEMYERPKLSGFRDLADIFGENVEKVTEKQTEIVVYLMKKYNPDVFFVYFEETENAHHYAWKYLDPRLPYYRSFGTKPLRGVVERAYVSVDRAIGKLIKEAGKDTTVIIMSDHGYGLKYAFGNQLYISSLLVNWGFLKLKEIKRARKLDKILDRRKIVTLLSKLKLYTIVKRFILKKGLKILQTGPPSKLSLEDVDWNKTKAYSFGDVGNIYINLKGREPEGIVRPGKEYIDLREDIVRRLYSLKDPKNNQKIIDRVYRREEIYHGEYLEDAPDLVALTKELPINSDSKNFKGSVDMLTDWHHLNGTLIMSGKNIRKDKIENAEIIDLAPTILYLLDIPVPDDMDGKVLKSILKIERKVRFQKSKPVRAKKREKEKVLTEEDEEKVKERLKKLGYL